LRTRRRVRRLDAWDWYVVTFAVVMVGAMAVSFAAGMVFPLLKLPPPQVPVVMAAVVTVLGAGTAVVSWLLGPVTVAAAEVWWILSGTVDRGQWLRHPLAKLVCLAALAGLVAAITVWALVGPGPGWSVALALAPLAVVLLMVLVQQHTTGPRLVLVVAGLLAVTLSAQPWVLVAALAAAVAAAGVLAWRGLGSMSSHDLLRTSRGAAALAGGAMGVDTGLELDLVARRTMRQPRRRIRGAGRGRRAVAWIDVQRVLARQPWLVLVGVALSDACCVAVTVAAPTLAPWTALLLMPTLAALMSVRRLTVRSKGALRNLPSGRCWGMATCAGAITVAVANSVVLTALLVGAGVPAGWALGMAVTVSSSALSGAWRLALSTPPDFSSGLVMSDAGAIPLGALLKVVRGWDVVIATAALMSLH
jgi:hypothetical protein